MLVSFEFGRIFTKDNRKLSVLYAFLIALAPIVQWWYSINGIVELFVFGQAALVLIYYYFQTDKLWKKALETFGIMFCAGGYIMTFYPAWMVPLAWVFLAALIAILVENRKTIKIRKTDVILWLAGAALLAGMLIYFYLTSKDTISTIMNTVYPGRRKVNGGDIQYFPELFRGWESWLLTFTEGINQCEKSGFLDFFPMGIIFSFIIVIWKKKRDIWLIVLNVVNLFLLIYLLVGLPDIIANITLMAFCIQGRCILAIGFLNIIILLRAISMGVLPIWNALISVITGGIVGNISLYLLDESRTPVISVVIVMFSVIAVLGLTRLKGEHLANVCVIGGVSLSLIGGGLVNPINSGMDEIYDNALLSKIEQINNEEEGLWAVCISKALYFDNLPTVAGAKCLNATALYPDAEIWKALGLEEEEYSWNRYLYFPITLDNEADTHLELIQDDLAYLHTSVEKLQEVGVDYILTYDDLADSEALELLYDKHLK